MLFLLLLSIETNGSERCAVGNRYCAQLHVTTIVNNSNKVKAAHFSSLVTTTKELLVVERGGGERTLQTRLDCIYLKKSISFFHQLTHPTHCNKWCKAIFGVVVGAMPFVRARSECWWSKTYCWARWKLPIILVVCRQCCYVLLQPFLTIVSVSQLLSTLHRGCKHQTSQSPSCAWGVSFVVGAGLAVKFQIIWWWFFLTG